VWNPDANAFYIFVYDSSSNNSENSNSNIVEVKVSESEQALPQKCLWSSGTYTVYGFSFPGGVLPSSITITDNLGYPGGLIPEKGATTLLIRSYAVEYAPGTQGMWDVADETTSGLAAGANIPAFGKSGANLTDTQAPGWVFDGWSPDPGNYHTTSDIASSTLTFTAQWKLTVFTVDFVSWDGSLIVSQSVDYGGDAVPPIAPVRAGYTFAGWQGSYDNVTSNQVITAQYDPIVIPGVVVPTTPPNVQPPAVLPTPYGQLLPPVAPVPTAAPAPTPPTPATPTITPTTTIKPTETPQAAPTATIPQPEAPLAAPPTASWALANLVLAGVGTLAAVVFLAASLFRKRANEASMSSKYAAQQRKAEAGRRKGITLSAVSILLGAVAIVMFAMTENMSTPISFVDLWTIPHVAILLVQAVVLGGAYKLGNVKQPDKITLPRATQEAEEL